VLEIAQLVREIAGSSSPLVPGEATVDDPDAPMARAIAAFDFVHVVASVSAASTAVVAGGSGGSP
jgi:hypothetical protein